MGDSVAETIDVEKIKLTRETAREMAKLPLEDLNLLLHSAGRNEFDSYQWHGDRLGNREVDDGDRRQMVSDQIRDLPKAQLMSLSTAMQQLFSAQVVEWAAAPEEPQALRLFASHLNSQRQFVHQVADGLKRWGIHLFVAHDDIEPDELWHEAIETSLQSVHAGVVFLHPGFIESPWCDQEVGWLLGRGVPVRTLMFNRATPYGPVGKRQGVQIPDSLTASQVAENVAEWIAGRHEIRRQYHSSMAQALADSPSFEWTNRIWSRIANASDLTDGQVATIAAAVRDNSQVFRGECREAGLNNRTGFPEVLIPYLLRQPGATGNVELLAEVAEARGLSPLLAALPTGSSEAVETERFLAGPAPF